MARQIEIGPQRLLTPRTIYERLNGYVIGQERAKRAVAIAAYNHQKRLALKSRGGRSLVKKSNILLIGPTGSGKTHIARNLAGILDVPFTVVDATEFTEAGYYGKDVEVMVADLLLRANHDVHEAQRGIIFIDEVDKIARRSQGARTGAGSRDIGGEGVQQAMLKLLEGRKSCFPERDAALERRFRADRQRRYPLRLRRHLLGSPWLRRRALDGIRAEGRQRCVRSASTRRI